MKYCTMCGKQLMDEAIFCPGCGCASESCNKRTVTKDEVSVGLCILAFFIPLFGIIYWPVKHDETPKKAKACGITGIVGAVIPIVLWFVLVLTTIATAAMYY